MLEKISLRKGRFQLLAFAVCLIVTAPCRAQIFLPDDPIWTDPDRLDVPPPEPREVGDYYDFWINTFGSPGAYEGPALNANTLGEVPNSSWYTNRHYRHPMSIEEIRHGPNTTGGPSTAEPWRVVAAKTEGKTAGMEIVDARGDRYILKFDPIGHIELASGAEVIATKLLFALGYHVPENYPVRFRRDQLVPGSEAEGDSAAARVTNAAIDEILSVAAQYEDGSYRALASLYLPGEPLGPFLYYGTRPDDANDIIPHEARRELRGLRVISAWLDHTDSRSMNSLDVLIEEGDSSFVRHYLIDFGSTLGASPLGPKKRWEGHEYILEGDQILLRTVSLGLAGLDWAGIEYPGLPAVGHLAVGAFAPEDWRPQYPNPAFRRADADDEFWAAKQIARFTDEEIRAAVASAEYSDPAVADYVARALIHRRDAIAETYLKHGGGLDRFTVEEDMLTFTDVREEAGVRNDSRRRSVIWRPFDNWSGELGAPIDSAEWSEPRLPIPQTPDPFLVADIRTDGLGFTRVFLRSGSAGREVVGIERQ